ncbi:MAG TPA: hypothetical protein VHA52_01410 [Candidatus Babeliaceae bacterium]|nr:hypothetical protein [Candidatus Babeliaceae bacterium]
MNKYESQDSNCKVSEIVTAIKTHKTLNDMKDMPKDLRKLFICVDYAFKDYKKNRFLQCGHLKKVQRVPGASQALAQLAMGTNHENDLLRQLRMIPQRSPSPLKVLCLARIAQSSYLYRSAITKNSILIEELKEQIKSTRAFALSYTSDNFFNGKIGKEITKETSLEEIDSSIMACPVKKYKYLLEEEMLFTAITIDNIAALNYFLNKGISPNTIYTSFDQSSLLDWAIKFGSNDVLETLLERGASASKSQKGLAPLILAVTQTPEEKVLFTVKLLMDYGAKETINYTDRYANVIHRAAKIADGRAYYTVAKFLKNI